MSLIVKEKKRRVFLVDDHPLVREWLSSLLNQQSDLAACGQAADRAEALQRITSIKPAIAVIDISLEDGSGLELIKDVKAMAPEVAIVVLSMHDEMLYAERALRAGARGYVMKRDVAENVLQAIRCVLDGNLYLSEKVAQSMAEKLIEGSQAGALSPVEKLSDRELEVFQLLGRGCTTRQIAENLSISMSTVQAFSARIKEKLHLVNATELLREAILWHEGRQTR